MSFINLLNQVVENSPTKVGFVSIKGYTNSKGEVQNALINVGGKSKNAKKKDVKYLTNLDVNTLKFEDKVLLEKARVALLTALLKPAKVQSEAQKNAYSVLGNGVKIHNSTNDLYIFGSFVSSKVVSVSDEVGKLDTRKPLTKAKDFIRKGMKSTKYRQYKVSSVGQVTANGKTIKFKK